MPIRVTADHVFHSFARGLTPAATVDAGSSIVLQTRDCYDGQADLESEKPCDDGIDRSRCNPATGPVYVRGAQVGDTLVARIESISLADVGVIFGTSCDGSRREGILVHISDGKAILPGGCEVAVEPMVGVIGVAPRAGEVSNSLAGDHGGNLDAPDVRAGTSVYLPVAETGAMFGVGDLHALQGEGEVGGQGVEITGDVTVHLDVIEGQITDGPVLVTDDYWAVVGVGESIDEAIGRALMRSRDIIIERVGVHDHEAEIILSTLCDVRICQIVCPTQTVQVCIPRWLVGDPEQMVE